MRQPASLIMLQFLTWVADRPRRYADAMDAWRTSCPRLSVWEDAILDGLIACEGGRRGPVRLTAAGRAILLAAETGHADPAAGAGRPRAIPEPVARAA